MDLYRVVYREGEDELQKYIVAIDEPDVQQHIADLAGAAYIKIADDTTGGLEYTFEPGPTQLTKKDDGSGLWEETA